MNFQAILMPKGILKTFLSQKTWSVGTILILSRDPKYALVSLQIDSLKITIDCQEYN